MTYFSYKYYYVQEKNQCQILAECLSRENDPNKYHRSGQCRCGTDKIFASSNAEYFLLLFCVSLVNAIFYCYNTFGDRLPAALVYFYDNLWLLVLVWNWDPTFWEVSQNGYQPHGKRVASHEKEKKKSCVELDLIRLIIDSQFPTMLKCWQFFCELRIMHIFL